MNDLKRYARYIRLLPALVRSQLAVISAISRLEKHIAEKFPDDLREDMRDCEERLRHEHDNPEA